MAAPVESRCCKAGFEGRLNQPPPVWKDWLDEHDTGSRASSGPVMTDVQQPADIEDLRRDLLDRMEALPFFDWSPALLRALIAVFDLNGITSEAEHSFRPYIVR
jgi:hypothetical protein